MANLRSGIYLVSTRRPDPVAVATSASQTVKLGAHLSGYWIAMARWAVIPGRGTAEYSDPAQGITVEAQPTAADASRRFRPRDRHRELMIEVNSGRLQRPRAALPDRIADRTGKCPTDRISAVVWSARPKRSEQYRVGVRPSRSRPRLM